MEHVDFLVIGAGIAGISVACELAAHGSVAILEQEAAPGYHSTGRSAAVTSENYGPLGWQILVSASRPFLAAPPPGFSEHQLLREMGALYFATAAEEAELRDQAAELARRGVAHRLLPAQEAGALSPTVRTAAFTLALHEPGCADIDAHALLQGFLRAARARGAALHTGAAAETIERRDGTWRVNAGDRVFSARTLINAAGAWAETIAHRAGLPGRGITPYRRTAITFDPPAGAAIATWPMTFDVAETWYFKTEGGRIMVSPVDKTKSAPCDAAPDELDIAIAADRIQQATTMTVRRIHSSWAGLRTFAPDSQPVIGPDPVEPSFIWLAGQGGNGVMASPAAARVAAALAISGDMPGDVAALGLTAAMVSPARLVPTGK